MKKEMRIAALFLTLLALTGYVVFDYFEEDRMFEDNKNFTENFQSFNNVIVKAIFIIASTLGYPFGIGVILFVVYILYGNKLEILTFYLYSLACLYISSLLKLLYHDPRPFWVYPGVNKGFLCDLDFGNPSGHAFTSSLMFPILIWELCHETFLSKDFEVSITSIKSIKDNAREPIREEFEVSIDEENNPLFCFDTAFKEDMGTIPSFSGFKNSIIVIFSFLLVGLICISRVYLGSHSYNQILLGFMYGSFFLVYYYLYFKMLIFRMIRFLSFKNEEFFLKKNLFQTWLLVFMVASNLMAIAFFLYASEKFVLLPTYVDNINSKCGITFQKNSGIQYKVALNCAVINGGIGCLLGLVTSKGKADDNSFQRTYGEISFFKKILRVLVLFLVEIVAIAILLLKFTVPEYFYAQYIIYTVALFIAGFSIIHVYPLALNYFKLDVKGDFLKKE